MTPIDVGAIHDHIVAAAMDCGEVVVERSGPATSLGAGDTLFATLTVGPRGVDLRLTLPGGHRLPGIVKLLSGGDDVAHHTVRLRSVEDVDAEIRAWLCEAHSAAAASR